MVLISTSLNLFVISHYTIALVISDEDPCGGPCQNGGQCITIERFGSFCICPPKYIGSHCEQEDPCGGPCQNGGQCITTEQFGSFCKCPSEYTGSHCQQKNTCGGCQNGGYCQITPQSGSYCECRFPFSGSHCQQNGTSCALHPCAHNCNDLFDQVTCFRYTLPRTLYPFVECVLDVDPCRPNPCKNGGTCIPPGDVDRFTTWACVGWPEYYYVCGPASYSECINTPCVNGTACYDDYFCVCPDRFFGTNCEESVD